MVWWASSDRLLWSEAQGKASINNECWMWRRERLEELFISCRCSSLHFPLLSQMSHSPSLGVSIRRVGRVIPLLPSPSHILSCFKSTLLFSMCHLQSFSGFFSTNSPSQLSLLLLLLLPFVFFFVVFFFFFSRPRHKIKWAKSVGELNPNVSRILSQTHESRVEMTCWSQLKGRGSSPLMCTITDVPTYLQAVWYWLFDGTIELIPAHLGHVGGKIWWVQESQVHILQECSPNM